MDKWASQRDLYYSVAPQLNSNASHVTFSGRKGRPICFMPIVHEGPTPHIYIRHY